MRYVTTPRRMTLGLAGGVLTGAALVTLYLALAWIQGATPRVIASQWPFLVLVFIVSAVIWAIGLVALGLPVWLFLHYRKRRHWLWAVSVGAVLTFMAVFLIAMETDFFRGMVGLSVNSGVDPATMDDTQRATQKWWSAGLASFVLSVIGMAVAFAVWRIAYRPSPNH